MPTISRQLFDKTMEEIFREQQATHPEARIDCLVQMLVWIAFCLSALGADEDGLHELIVTSAQRARQQRIKEAN